MLSVKNLNKAYSIHPTFGKRGKRSAVSDVSFDIAKGSTLSIVGESGSGKTTIGRCVCRLIPQDSGDISFDGFTPGHAKPEFRRKVQMVFQDPFSTLNPRMTVGETLDEVLYVHKVVPKGQEPNERRQLLEIVGLPASLEERYPHELSGGQRQRVGIARSLAVRPSFLVLDEPVSALDVSVQAQILNLLRALQSRYALTFLFIAHDLAVVRQMGGTVAVLLKGEIMEKAESSDLFENPMHPYTRLLLESIPGQAEKQTKVISRNGADAACVFYDRCPIAEDRCCSEKPALKVLHSGREVKCHLV